MATSSSKRKKAGNMPKGRPQKTESAKLQTETPQTPEAVQDIPAGESDLKQVIEQSKEKLHQEALKSVKRGRGRPPKETAASGQQGATGPQTASTGPSVSPPTPLPNLTPQLGMIVKIASSIPAARYGVAEIQFTDEEALAGAQAIQEVLNAFFPDVNAMSPKTAAVAGAVLVFGSIGFNKFIIYQQSRRVKAPEGKKLEKEGPDDKPAPQAGKNVHPLDFLTQ